MVLLRPGGWQLGSVSRTLTRSLVSFGKAALDMCAVWIATERAPKGRQPARTVMGKEAGSKPSSTPWQLCGPGQVTVSLASVCSSVKWDNNSPCLAEGSVKQAQKELVLVLKEQGHSDRPRWPWWLWCQLFSCAQKSSSRQSLDFPGSHPWGSAIQPALTSPSCLRLPQFQGSRAHRHYRKCSSQLRSWTLKWLLQTPRLCSAGYGSWHRGFSAWTMGESQNGSQIMHCEKITAVFLAPWQRQ